MICLADSSAAESTAAGGTVCHSTVEDFYRDNYLPLHLLGCSPRTPVAYETAVTQWKRFSPSTAIGDIDAKLLASWAQQMLAAGKSAGTVNCYLRHVKAVLRAAFSDPSMAPVAPKLREPKRVPLAYTTDEFHKVLTTAKQWPGTIGGSPAADWWTAVLLVDWEAGLRLTALMSLLTVDFLPDQNGLLSRPETEKDDEGGWYFLPPETIKAVQRIVRPEEPLLFHPGVKPETVGRWLRKILDKSGIYAPKGCGMRWHRIRKSKASYTEAAGADAQLALNHSARSVTERYLDPRIVGRKRFPFMPKPK